MPDILFSFRGTNGSIYVASNCLVVAKTNTLTIPLSEIVALEFQEGKFLQDGLLMVRTKEEKDHLIFEMTKDYDNVITVRRRDTSSARKFIDQVEEFLYMSLNG